MFPKRCGHLPDKQVVDAADVRTDARTPRWTPDPTTTCSWSPAPTPAHRWGSTPPSSGPTATPQAGADVIFVEAPQGVDEIERIAREVDAPLLINLVLGGMTPLESSARLQRTGLRDRDPSRRIRWPRHLRDAAGPVRTQRQRPGRLYADHARRLLQPRRHGRMAPTSTQDARNRRPLMGMTIIEKILARKAGRGLACRPAIPSSSTST